MTDTVETGHTVIPEIEPDERVPSQDGLRVLSVSTATAGGLTGENCVVLLSRDAILDLPTRLADRLLKTGHAKEA